MVENIKKVNRIDKELIKQRFSNAAKEYNKEALAQSHIHSKILNYLKSTEIKSFSKVLEIGCGTGRLTKLIEDNFKINKWIINDLVDCISDSDIFSQERLSNINFLFGDAEHIEFGLDYDLIISSSAIQWFYNPLEFIKKSIERLNNKGVLVITTFAQDNLLEIKNILGIGLEYHKASEFKAVLSNKNFDIDIEEEYYTLEFKSPLEVLKHLKNTGVTAVGAKEFVWTKTKLKNFEDQYKRLYSTPNNSIRLTYHPIYIYVRKI